jgi:hypothetical protein
MIKGTFKTANILILDRPAVLRNRMALHATFRIPQVNLLVIFYMERIVVNNSDLDF